MKLNLNYLIIILLFYFIKITFGSYGDQTEFFKNCCKECRRKNCTQNGIEFQTHSINYYKQNIFDKLFLWSCEEECDYSCMWRTVEAFINRKYPIPQFYGKWPFIRLFGLQEPASVVFSIMNFYAHLHLLRKFRKEVRRDSPCYFLWHIFGLTCLNGWIWSTVFHARDSPLTELLDYAFAYSIVLVTFYCMIIRMIYNKSFILRGIISAIFFSFYINYFSYLGMGRFSYSLNMKTNIVTGIMSGIGWILWYIYVRKKRPYAWKIFVFYLLIGASICLEILDFPPILWIFDAHSLWHLSSFPLNFLIYSFAIDDCKTLRIENIQATSKINKSI